MKHDDDISQYFPGQVLLAFLWMFVSAARDYLRSEGRITIAPSHHDAQWQCADNRHHRATVTRTFHHTRYYHQHRPLFGRDLAPKAFIERMALYSVHGRVSVYNFRYWCSRAQGRASMSYADHTKWWQPQGHKGQSRSIDWTTYIWPGWMGLNEKIG